MKLELRRVTRVTAAARDAKRRWPERHSLLLRLEQAGVVGLGEASPLPGYSRDTLEAAEAALRSIDPAALASALQGESVRSALTRLSRLVPASAPAARMALETAALDLLARQRGVSAPALLGAAPDASRSLAALLGPTGDAQLTEQARAAVTAGFRHLKLKLAGGEALERELVAVAQLRQLVGQSVSLRLDANGALSAPELERAWPVLERLDLELFEEPGASLPSLDSRIPLALDESLQGLGPREVEQALRERSPRAIVLKPTALGGLAHCLQLAELAHAANVAVVVSHTFDGIVAWRAAAALALALPPGAAHGLAPHAGLAAPSLDSLPVRTGTLQGWSEPGLGVAESAWPA